MPLLRVELTGPSNSDSYLPLVDSGSDTNVFSMKVAVALGVTNGTPVDWGSQSDEGLSGIMAPVKYKLEFEGAEVSWKADTIFSDLVSQRNVLGRIGFFDHFIVCFWERRKEIDIRLYENSQA